MRIALIGVGMWGQRAHLPALFACPGVDVVSLCDQQIGSARDVADQHGIQFVFSDAHEMLRQVTDLDAVVISTPTDTHHDVVLAAAEAGVHIFCEKPLAYDVAQAREMLEAVESRNLMTKMGFIFRFSPVLQRMKELVDEGYIGTLHMFESVGGNEQFIDPERPLHWKMERSRAGGGVFVEYGAHLIDLAIWFGGAIERVVAHGLTLIPERPTHSGGRSRVDVDDACSWIAAYEAGGEALFRTSWSSLPLGGGGVRLYGSRGSLAQVFDPSGRRTEQLLGATVDDREPRVLYEFSPEFDPDMDAGDFPLGLLGRWNARLIQSFIDDIQAGRASAPSFADGLATQRVLAAIRCSLDEQRWVDIKEE